MRTMIATPVGELTLIASADGLRAVLWPGDDELRVRIGMDDDASSPASSAVLARAEEQLDEYFTAGRRSFDIPLDAIGSEFQRSAWAALLTIPYGDTISYGEQAARLGDRRKARAVGAANGRNPISIIVPCHRVVGASGALTGFAAGVGTKAWLLDHERAVAFAGH
jgi:methylated-DNA-[protein]-cysteine S-methyltransferase